MIKNEWVLPFNKALERIMLIINGFKTISKPLINAIKSNNYIKIGKFILNELKNYQRKNSDADIIPSISMVNAEIFYNKLNIFKKTYQYYLLFGFSLLIIFFINIFRVKKNKIIEWIKKIIYSLLILPLYFMV